MADSSSPDTHRGSSEAVLRAAAAFIRQDYTQGAILDTLDLIETPEMSDLEFARNEIPSLRGLDEPFNEDQEYAAEPSWGADAVQGAAQRITPIIMWLTDEDPERDYSVYSALIVILESARTTAMAIALLMRRGYLADAEARWRGLYEITAQLALIVSTGRESSAGLNTVATAYLVHSGLWDTALHPIDASHPIVPGEDYGWLQAAGGEWVLKGTKSRISQSKVLKAANLSVPAEGEQLHHGSVHMSSVIAASGGIANGSAPAGASRPRAQGLSRKALRTLDDLVANAALAITLETGCDRPEVLLYAYGYHSNIQAQLRD